MNRRLPPLNALRAFEAAARHASMSAAADELSVTPAAVSHQVKALEDYFGVSLFHRAVRTITLSAAGATLLPYLSDGFDRLTEGCQKLAQHENSGPLMLSSAPAFAAKWLMRNINDFNERHPEVPIRIDGSLAVTDFARDEIDAVVRFGQGPYRGLHADALAHEDVVPVCAPSLLNGSKPLRKPSDLAQHMLIHVDWFAAPGVQPDWAMWLKTAGLDDIDATKGPMLTTDSLAVEAAISGVGVALLSEFLVEPEIASGRLVKPFDLVLTSSYQYWFLCPPSHLERPKVAAFRAWLLDRLAQDSAVRLAQ